jgi:SAM-dependent methyltransferase
MKKLLEVDLSFEHLYRMLIAPIRSKLLLAGIELKVFNQLSQPKSAEDVAEAIGTHPENTRLFLDGLATIDLVVKKDDLYQNTVVTQTFLVEGAPISLGQLFTSWAQMWDPALKDLPRLVREGPLPPSPEAEIGAEDMWAQYATSVANVEMAGIAQRMAKIVANLPEFPLLGKMLDLGGGPGIIGIAIVSAHPSMKGVIFDRPAVAEVAESFIKEYKMENRIEVLSGDFKHDSIGDGYDLIWASSVLNFVKDNIDPFMKKIFDALNPGGVFISCHDGLTRERTKPEIMVLSWLSVALMGTDMGLDQGFIADSMLRVGFKSVRSRTLDTPIGPMDLDIGRK